MPSRVYATYNPAYAVAHSFPWSSDDGVDIKIDGDNICVLVPKEKVAVLNQSVCIYGLSDETFVFTPEEETGLTYHSASEVAPVECHCFASVKEAMLFWW